MPPDWVSKSGITGVLRKNIDTGAYTCDIYMPKRPDRTWDRPTLSLGHELAHCLGFVHH